jgi:hypothetical protein
MVDSLSSPARKEEECEMELELTDFAGVEKPRSTDVLGLWLITGVLMGCALGMGVVKLDSVTGRVGVDAGVGGAGRTRLRLAPSSPMVQPNSVMYYREDRGYMNMSRTASKRRSGRWPRKAGLRWCLQQTNSKFSLFQTNQTQERDQPVSAKAISHAASTPRTRTNKSHTLWHDKVMSLRHRLRALGS